MSRSVESLIRLALMFGLVAFCLWLFYDRVDERDIKTLFALLVGGIAGETGLNKVSNILSHRNDPPANGE